MNIRGSFWFVERVAPLVSLPHPVDDEHDEQDGAEQPDHSTPYNSCKIVSRYKKGHKHDTKQEETQTFRLTPLTHLLGFRAGRKSLCPGYNTWWGHPPGPGGH